MKVALYKLRLIVIENLRSPLTVRLSYRAKSVINMESETLSNAQSLRLIGQHLRGLSIDAFDLEKIGNDYLVRVDRNQPNGKSPIGMGPSKNMQKMDLAQGKIASSLHFHSSEIFRLQFERRSRRAEFGGMPNASSLGLRMRVLGQYLDLKGADDFTISWAKDSVKISFLQKVQSFSPSNLYDFGICMYLKRSEDDSQTSTVDRIAI